MRKIISGKADVKWFIVTAGWYHTTAIKSDGTLWAWGYNNYGQLGDGTVINKNTPVQIGADTDWITVIVGLNYTTAIKRNDTLWAWGDNRSGQLGDGTVIEKNVPIQIDIDT